MTREIHIEFSQAAHPLYVEAQATDGQLFKAIEREVRNLRSNPQHGIHIPRGSIRSQVVDRYGTDRLWKIDILGYRRLIYTLIGDEEKLVVLVLEIVDHKKYDRVFGYRKR